MTERGVDEILPSAYITSPIPGSPIELTPVPSRPESPQLNNTFVENNNEYHNGSEADMLDLEFDETEL